jgi:hypothetical protein
MDSDDQSFERMYKMSSIKRYYAFHVYSKGCGDHCAVSDVPEFG